MGNGDGWTTCSLGHRHWGRYGAAGLLLVAVEGDVAYVLLQHRAAWSHHGDTWGVPGGARDEGESAVEAALREACEETGIDAGQVEVQREVVDAHGGWAYTTVVGAATRRLAVGVRDRESIALEWVPLAEVEQRALHPGFADSWPRHLAALTTAEQVVEESRGTG